MSIEPGLVDANVLVYALNADAPQHASARALIEFARSPKASLYVTSQILCEFYSIVTNPRRVAKASTTEEALFCVLALLALPGLSTIPVRTDTVSAWISLLRRHPVTGAGIFDVQIIATMLSNNIQRIYTFNTSDFVIFPELEVISPQSLHLS